VDETLILSAIANGAYKWSPQFVPVNRSAYGSTAAAGVDINVWVTSADFASYSKIDPDKSGSHVELNPGAMIVREVLKNGVPAKITLMVKGPPGYNPDLGDFWFGVTDPSGTPLVDNGAELTGKLTACFGCHLPRKDDGYLFGVAESARGLPGASDSDAGAVSGSGTAQDSGAVPINPPSPPAPPPPPPGPTAVCGDFYCEVGESCSSCPADCGQCAPPAAVCGDRLCSAGESCLTCPVDCGECGGGGDDDGERH
jgi:hypothetical protein